VTRLLEGAVEGELLPNLFATLAVRGEMVDEDERGRDAYLSPRVLLRWGLPFQRLRS
jgi:hypothetical protein